MSDKKKEITKEKKVVKECESKKTELQKSMCYMKHDLKEIKKEVKPAIKKIEKK